MPNAWAIKLGSGGRCIPFCERHQIVGVGWRDVSADVLFSGTRAEISEHVKEVCQFYKTQRERGLATGQLWRFARECQIGDYVLYYDPAPKHVRVCRVVSGPCRRDVDMDDPADIWFLRKVEYPVAPVPILDFPGTLKGRLLGPRMSFWGLRPFEFVDRMATGQSALTAEEGREIVGAYHALAQTLVKQLHLLNDQDWELLVVDYFKAQGAHVDERKVGGSRAVIDAEARFDHGELPDEIWRIQVKRFQDRQVDWPMIEYDLERVGEAKFCFVSVFGFTAEARARADEEDVRLMEAEDFARFLLSGKYRDSLRSKLQIPDFAVASEEKTDG